MATEQRHSVGFRGLMRRLYRGESNVGFIPHRRRWYIASGTVLIICLLSILLRGFNEGIDFKGGTQYQLSGQGTTLTTQSVTTAFQNAGLTLEEPTQVAGSGSSRSYLVRSLVLSPDEQNTITDKVIASLKGQGLNQNKVNINTVSGTWGSDVSRKALYGLFWFMIIVSIYISIRFQYRMAIAAIIALIHDLVLTAGVYSLIGFEVTPSTIVGLLTILGFSLYDTVVIFDKVGENTRDLTAGSRFTFSEATNRAVNQTLMRSINTSLISLLPVAGLLFIGALILGVGTIKDLALVMFVGLATGAYSSLFLAAPIVVDLTERLPAYKALTKRVQAKRASEAARAEAGGGELALAGARRSGAPAPAPRPGARPAAKAPVRAATTAAAKAPAKAAGKPNANRAKSQRRKK
jgi:preprotein translocase subunit SecF